jgi:hypothetical protein
MIRAMRTPWQRMAPHVAMGFGALAGILGLLRLRSIRGRLDVERQWRAEERAVPPAESTAVTS